MTLCLVALLPPSQAGLLLPWACLLGSLLCLLGPLLPGGLALPCAISDRRVLLGHLHCLRPPSQAGLLSPPPSLPSTVCPHLMSGPPSLPSLGLFPSPILHLAARTCLPGAGAQTWAAFHMPCQDIPSIALFIPQCFLGIPKLLYPCTYGGWEDWHFAGTVWPSFIRDALTALDSHLYP